MKHNEYDVVLTNGATEQIYRIHASNEEQAIILAQARAINLARGYQFVSITLVEDSKVYCLTFKEGRLSWN